MKKYFYLVIFLLPIFICGTCNHEKVSGEIKTSQLQISLGDTIELDAIIFDKDKVLKKIMWDVNPSEDAIIISPLFYGNDSTEYKALFTANKPGKYRILLSCFYKQTNPTFIDELEIEVIDTY